MSYEQSDLEAMLDEAIAAVRLDQPSSSDAEGAATRVRAQIRHHRQIDSCAGFRLLLPEYAAGILSPARTLLVEDHIQECLFCRKTLQAIRTPPSPVKQHVASPPVQWGIGRRYAMAATLVMGVALASWFTYNRTGQPGPRATLASAEGPVYKLINGAFQPVSAGGRLTDRERLRTGIGGHAMLRLSDGSIVEMGERAELSVSASRDDTTVKLPYGHIIVQAAKREIGHLYIAPDDCLVAVTGTVFSVNSGTKGSRVSVVEGEVHVRQAGTDRVLHSGEQATSHPSLGAVSVSHEVAWSRNAAQYVDGLRALATLKSKLEAVQMPPLRYSSSLLDAVPDGTTVYVSLPNFGPALEEAQRLINDQTQQTAALRQWTAQRGADFTALAERVRLLSGYVGEEVVLAFQPCESFCGVLIADVRRSGLREFLQAEIAKERSGSGLRILQEGNLGEEGRAEPAVPGQFLVALNGNRIVVGRRPAMVTSALRAHSGFQNTDLGRLIADRFQQGTGIMVAADLQRILEKKLPNLGKAAELTGMDDARYFIAEQRTAGARAQYSAVLNFAGERRGIASWLGAPSPMAGLSFVSSDAQAAGAFVFKRPTLMLSDLLDSLGSTDGSARSAHLEEYLDTDLRTDVAAALGGEVIFALDGPILPLPAWKAIVEVNQPDLLQAAIDKMVAKYGSLQSQRPALSLKREQDQGQTWYTLHIGDSSSGMQIHYLYSEGYLIAGLSKGIVAKAIDIRRSGVSLSESAKFRDLIPQDRHANFSAMLYQNVAGLFEILAAGRKPDALKSDAPQGKLGPTLVCAYGDENRIEIASHTGLVGLAMQNLIGPMLLHGTQRPQKSYR